MNIENTQSQMRKGILEFCILSIIRRGEAYPSDIVEEMKTAGLHILEGTLYPLLTRLKNSEMLTYRWVESNSGPPRKYFLLTEKGEVSTANWSKPGRNYRTESTNSLIKKRKVFLNNFNQIKMKKIININLSGRVIPIEDAAYENLQRYIESLRGYFANDEAETKSRMI
jgi:PadR family transcriptional regulator PadR